MASDIVLLDVRSVCGFADYFVICSAESERQISAVVEEIDRTLTENGVRFYRSEGKPDSGWVLMDLDDVIVHIFSPEQRSFYKLEDLWAKAVPLVHLQ